MGAGENRRKKQMGQGIYIKDLWARTTVGRGGLNMQVQVGRAGENNGKWVQLLLSNNKNIKKYLKNKKDLKSSKRNAELPIKEFL